MYVFPLHLRSHLIIVVFNIIVLILIQGVVLVLFAWSRWNTMGGGTKNVLRRGFQYPKAPAINSIQSPSRKLISHILPHRTRLATVISGSSHH